MKKNNKSNKAMHFETKGFEAKIGRTILTRRPYAKVTVSEDMVYLGAAMTVAGAKQIGKLGKAAATKVSGLFKHHEEEEDFMEQ